jgi:NADPH-dependent curcumin reductase CurA
MAVVNRRLVLAQRPHDAVDGRHVRLEESPVPAPGDGQALARVRHLSIDPTIRTWMNDAPGYLPPIGIGDVIRSGGTAEVVESNTDRYRPGDLVYGMTGWQDYALIGRDATDAQVVPPGVPGPTAINVFGVSGLTAYFGLLEVGRLKEGDTVVVSGAAGGTGSLVGQIAKIMGAGAVIGIAGSDEKCRWLVEELGFDAAINYRSDDIPARLRELCPTGIDLYFDNVGGRILDICLARLAMRGRVVLCGAIAGYNDPAGPHPIRNYTNLIIRRGRMEGFLVFDYAPRYGEAQKELAAWVADGRLKHTEHIVHGLENAVDALNLLFDGGNTGKVVVEV